MSTQILAIDRPNAPPPAMEPLCEELRGAVEADACVLSMIGADGGPLALFGAAGVDAHRIELYAREQGRANHRLFAEAEISAAGEPLADEQLLASAFFRDWMQPLGLRYMACARVACSGERMVMLACFRDRSRGAFGPASRRSFACLMPLLRQIATLSDALRLREGECDAMMGALEQLTLGVVLLDSRGRPAAANESAMKILRERRGLSIGPNGGIAAAMPQDNALLRRTIARVIAGEGEAGTATAVIAIADPAEPTPITVGVSRLKREGAAHEPHGIAAALFISDPAAPPGNTDERLRQLYGLTRLEAQLAVGIAQGFGLDAIAEELRISIHTARAYLKQIFAKTNVHRQASLVRVVLGGAAQIR